MLRQVAAIEGIGLFQNTVSIIDDRIFLIQIYIGEICLYERAFQWLKLSGYDFQQSCFSAAVASFYTKAVPAFQLEAERSLPKLWLIGMITEGNLLCRNQYFTGMKSGIVKVSL